VRREPGTRVAHGGCVAYSAFRRHPDASYVLRDGSIYIVGNDGMKEMLEKFNELFQKTHPGVKFMMELEGSSTGIGGLTAGVSALAPMGCEAWPADIGGFREQYGVDGQRRTRSNCRQAGISGPQGYCSHRRRWILDELAGDPESWCQALLTADHATTVRLVTDPRVGFFSFIGSAPVGWQLRSLLAPGTRCALTLRPRRDYHF
jgi:hypothetical protein